MRSSRELEVNAGRLWAEAGHSTRSRHLGLAAARIHPRTVLRMRQLLPQGTRGSSAPVRMEGRRAWGGGGRGDARDESADTWIGVSFSVCWRSVAFVCTLSSAPHGLLKVVSGV